MSTDVDYVYWGIFRNKLHACENFVHRMGEKFRFTNDEYAEVDKDALEFANKLIKEWKNPVRDFSTVLCVARVNSLLVYITKTRKVDFGNYDIDTDGLGLRVICHGEEL